MTDPAARLRRMLALVPYVLKHQGATFQELCEVFDVSREELVRDLNLIFLCGQPEYTPADLIEVVMEGDRVYIGMADYFARPMRFTPAELAGLYLACSALAALAGSPSDSALRSAMERIRRAMGFKDLSPEEVERSLEVASPESRKGMLALLMRACEERRIVEMEYYSYGRDELSWRRAGPVSMVFRLGHWYLNAWDEKSREVRVFRVDRIKDLRLTGESFVPPKGKKSLTAGAGGIPEKGEILVRLRFSSRLAAWAWEQPLFTEKVKEGEELVCALRTDNLSWLERELLGWGTEVEILHPPELKERLQERVRKTLALYEKRRGGRRR